MLQQIKQENALLLAYVGKALDSVAGGDPAPLTLEEKCDVATAEVAKLEGVIFHHHRSSEQEEVAAEAQLATLEASAAEAASDLAHLKQHVLGQPNVHTGKLCSEHLLKYLADCQRDRGAAIDRCTAQAASARAKLHKMEREALGEAEAHDSLDAITFEKLKIDNADLKQHREQCARELLQAKRRKFDLLQVCSDILHSVIPADMQLIAWRR